MAPYRWVLTAIAVPAAVTILGVGVLALAFGRASSESLNAAQIVGRLLSYDAMRGNETIAGRTEPAICVEAEVRNRRGHPAPAALVVAGGRLLYDAGHGVRIAPSRRLADGIDRMRFLLAGCPWFIGTRISARLSRGSVIEAQRTFGDGVPTVSIWFGPPRAPLVLEVARQTFTPVALAFDGRRLRGSSDLVPLAEPPGDGMRILNAFRILRPQAKHA